MSKLSSDVRGRAKLKCPLCAVSSTDGRKSLSVILCNCQCIKGDRSDFPAPAWGQNHGSAPGLYGVPDLSVKLATDGYQRGHDSGCSCQVVRVDDNVSAAGCNGVA